MQLFIAHELESPLDLPINYQRIQQAIIYRNLENSHGLNTYMHESGFKTGQRQFRLFTFSLINGSFNISKGRIRFQGKIWWEIRSPEVFLIQTLAEKIRKNGISYGERHFTDVEVETLDETVETEVLPIRMVTPICVYSTDPETKKTYFYAPDEDEFYELVNENFYRKYKAYYGVEPESGIALNPVRVTPKDKFVTKYKDFYISGWKGDYILQGERRYLDFLYQAGLGAKNAQGFGLFIEKEFEE